MLALVSCGTVEEESECGDNDNNIEAGGGPGELQPVVPVLVGFNREYRYRLMVDDVCTFEHIKISAIVKVRATVDAVVDFDALASVAGGTYGLTFTFLPGDEEDYDDDTLFNYYEAFPEPFSISNVYPPPETGEVTAGINVRFPSLGTQADDDAFLDSNVAVINLTIDYWQQ